MDQTDIKNFDLNLMKIFVAILEERQVTRAARRVGLSQSALSNALGRLRSAFDDPLFVRSGREMVPTERAVDLEGPVRDALSGLERAMAAPAAFYAGESRRRFRIASADYCDFVVLPELSARASTEAPGVSLEVTQMPSAKLPAEQLRAGRYDLAIGYFTQIPQDCLMRDLFREDFVCIARKGHPRIRKRLTLKAFTEASHVLVAPTGERGSLVDDVLARRGLRRHIAVTTPHFLVPPRIVAASDLISTLARRVATAYAALYPLSVFKPPLEIASFPLNMVWHRRCDGTPEQQWIRDRVEQVCANL